MRRLRLTVNAYVPAAAGVPDMAPSLLMATPGGGLPEATVNLYGAVPPDPVNASEYAWPEVPLGSESGETVIAEQGFGGLGCGGFGAGGGGGGGGELAAPVGPVKLASLTPVLSPANQMFVWFAGYTGAIANDTVNAVCAGTTPEGMLHSMAGNVLPPFSATQ